MYRIGLMFVGMLALALGVAGMVIAVSGGGVVHMVMEGLRAVVFGLCGITFITAAVTCGGDFAKCTFRGLVRDIFSRRNLAEFVAFWVVVAIAVWVMRVLRD